MKRLTHADERSLRLMRSRLERAYVPLPPRDEQRNALPVSIQSEPIECSIFRISSEQSGCFLSIQCATDLSSGVYLDSAHADLPGTDVRFELLPEPEAGRFYIFPRDAYALERTVVINHEFPGTLYPARPWDGVLLLISYQPLSLSLKGCFPVHLVLNDCLGREASAEVMAWIDPTGCEFPSGIRRGTLFEKDPSDAQQSTESFEE
jgi:hypothetical protein